MIILKSVVLLKYTCGHGGKCFDLFPVIVMDHHIERLDKVMLCIFNSATVPQKNFRFREMQPVRRRV